MDARARAPGKDPGMVLKRPESRNAGFAPRGFPPHAYAAKQLARVGGSGLFDAYLARRLKARSVAIVEPRDPPPAATTAAPVQRIVIEGHDTDRFEECVRWIQELAEKGKRKQLLRIEAALLEVTETIDQRLQEERDEKIFRLLSVVKNALIPSEPLPAKKSAIYALPKSEWWRLFIDKRFQEQGALAFDSDQSPGFFYAMITAYEEALGQKPPEEVEEKKGLVQLAHSIWRRIKPPRETPEPSAKAEADPMDAAAYLRYHGMVRNLVLTAYKKAGGGSVYLNIPQGWSGKGVDFPMNEAGQIANPAALQQLIDSEIIRLDEGAQKFLGFSSAGSERAFVVVKVSQEETDTPQFTCHTAYDREDADSLVNRIFDSYYAALKRGKGNIKATLSAIVTVVRDLHVGHFFPDANGRVNIMLLLNKFLIENGFRPVVLRQPPGIFGGAQTVDYLVDAVIEGIAEFDRLTIEIGRLPQQTEPKKESKGEEKEEEEEDLAEALALSVQHQVDVVGSDLLSRFTLHLVDGSNWTCYVHAVLMELGEEGRYREVIERLGSQEIFLDRLGGVVVGSDFEERIIGVITAVTGKKFHTWATSVVSDDPGVFSKNRNGILVRLLHTGAHFSLLRPK